MTNEELGAMEQIRQLKARCMRAMDTKDWPLLASVFSDDVELDVRGGVTAGEGQRAAPTTEAAGIIRGHAAVLAFMTGNLQTLRCAHYASLPEIIIDSPDTAHAIWAQHDWLYFAPGAPHHVLRGYGHYHDRYQRVGNEWLISAVRLERLFIQID